MAGGGAPFRREWDDWEVGGALSQRERHNPEVGDAAMRVSGLSAVRLYRAEGMEKLGVGSAAALASLFARLERVTAAGGG